MDTGKVTSSASENSTATVPGEFILIAGKGAYPRILAESAKQQGIKRVVALAFKGETDPAIKSFADEVLWVKLGRLREMLEVLRGCGLGNAVMAGSIAPTHLFRVRLDKPAFDLLRSLPQKNAHTIFGAVVDQVRSLGIRVLPASTFMESHIPSEGLLSDRPAREDEKKDIALGLRVAAATSELDIGQTVVIKQGTILAVEAFEGTDETIRRAGRLGGPGAVVVKIAKRTHDMRFDIPVIGLRTMRVMKKCGVSALALQAGRAILLEWDEIVKKANKTGLCLLVAGRGNAND